MVAQTASELRSPSWVQPLLDRARAARAQPLSAHLPLLPADADLRWAYHQCEEITRDNSRTFYLASALAPQPKRIALRSLYALCRVSDDIVDSSDVDRLPRFSAWRAAVLNSGSRGTDPVLFAWAATCDRFPIPTGYVAQMLDTLALDLATTRFQRFEQLAEYCYGVASTVGLLAMSIIGHSGPDAVPYAVRLGVALQLTNVLRDIGEDWERGRLYLPLNELVRFGLSESDIAAGRIDRRWREFMRFQIDYNRQLYREATPGIGLLNRDGRLAVAAAAAFYQAILDDIENHDYDVFSRRAHVNDRDKLRLLPLVWWRSAKGGSCISGMTLRPK